MTAFSYIEKTKQSAYGKLAKKCANNTKLTTPKGV
jgi:hypothetical protein